VVVGTWDGAGDLDREADEPDGRDAAGRPPLESLRRRRPAADGGRVVYSTRGGEFHAFWSWTLPPRATFVCSLTLDALDPDTLPTGRYDISANLNLFPFGVQAHHPLSIVTG
jgi:hypothetical protein